MKYRERRKSFIYL